MKKIVMQVSVAGIDPETGYSFSLPRSDDPVEVSDAVAKDMIRAGHAKSATRAAKKVASEKEQEA